MNFPNDAAEIWSYKTGSIASPIKASSFKASASSLGIAKLFMEIDLNAPSLNTIALDSFCSRASFTASRAQFSAK